MVVADYAMVDFFEFKLKKRQPKLALKRTILFHHLANQINYGFN